MADSRHGRQYSQEIANVARRSEFHGHHLLDLRSVVVQHTLSDACHRAGRRITHVFQIDGGHRAALRPDRWLPLPRPSRPLLKKWRLQCPVNELSLILPSTAGGVLHPRTLYDALKRAQTTAGVRALDLKAFRRTSATALIEGGEAETQVARLMGHADTTVTRRIYAHAFDCPEGSRVAEGFAAAIFPGADTAPQA